MSCKTKKLKYLALVQKELSQKALACLHELEEPYKEVFILRTLNELSFQEIGQIYERKEGWARVTYHRAKLKIQEMLGKEE